MALSNWDTIAFDENGQSCTGIFMNKQKECIEIYKNWVHIHSPRMWRDKGSFMKPVIALLRHGSVNICHFEIELKRGPQNGVFVFASEFVRGRGNKYRYRYFGGIGCSGYVDKVEEVLKSLGRETEEEDYWVSGCESGPDVKGIHYIENYKTQEKIVYWDEDKQGKYNYGDDWVGVKKETLEEFFKWLEELAEEDNDDIKKWVKLCKKSKKLRYNQGNAFFAKALGVGLDATKVGKAKEPIANKIIANMNLKSKSK